jgi:hypothetical protein
VNDGLGFCRLVFVVPFDDFKAAEAQARGYLSHVLVETVDGNLYPVTFYDPVRLQQDLDERTKQAEPFVAEVGLIVVPEITMTTLEAAARGACRDGLFDYMKPIDRDWIRTDSYEWPPKQR